MKFLARTSLFLALVIGAHAIAYTLVPEPSPAKQVRPVMCATEDSVKCFWNASEQGNGLGEDVFN